MHVDPRDLPGRSAFALVFAFAFAFALCVVGCKSPPPGDGMSSAPTPNVQAPTYASRGDCKSVDECRAYAALRDREMTDCGGTTGRPCPAGHACTVDADCESGGCAYDRTCAMGASCTQLHGGQTCGPVDALDKQEDCCSRAKIGKTTVDRYLVTAGRMRAFLDRVHGNVQAWAASLPPERWNQEWTPRLPTSLDGMPGDPKAANTQLGPFYGKRACATGNHTGHTFWTPPSYGDTKDFSVEVLDAKALNCVPWHLLAALCAFDGGHLLLEQELHVAYTNLGTTPYPWGERGAYTTTARNDYAVGLWSYVTPNVPATAQRDEIGFLDAAFYVAPPGRRPLGANASGVSDLVGNLLEWVGDSERQFVWKGSFENHAAEADILSPPIDNQPYLVMRTETAPWRWPNVVALGSDPENIHGYYALGGRCGYDAQLSTRSEPLTTP